MNRAKTELPLQPHRPLPAAAAVLAALWLLLSPGSARAATTNQAFAPEIFSVGMAKVCFRNVNRNDAIAAYKIFLESAGRRFGNIYTAAAEIYDDTPSFEADIQRQPMNVAVMNSWQFLTMNIQAQMRPFFTVAENGKVGRKYLVLTRRDSGFNSLASLRGKDFMGLEFVGAGVGKIWFDTLFLSEQLGAPEKFFASTELVAKPTTAVLPVYFGKKSACLVDEASFDLMKELNPQVGQMLQIVAASDNYVDVVVCLREANWSAPKFKSDTITALRELGQDPAGQQICTLFRIDRMVPFEDVQLDTVRKLRATYEALHHTGSPGSQPTPLVYAVGTNAVSAPGPGRQTGQHEP
jgi:phosphonate transport system substrate-binding protein